MSKQSRSTGSMSGKNVNFHVTKASASSSTSDKTISGTNLNFIINSIGRWSLEEKKPKICMICKLSLKPEQKITQCPMCQSLFHQEHVVEWLRVKGKCPVCQQSLRPDGLQRVNL